MNLGEDLEFYPEETNDAALSVSQMPTELVSELRIQGASIYLPEKKILRPSNEEYREIFLKAVPPDMADDISMVLRQKQRRLSFFGGCIITFFLLAMILFLYIFFPEPLGGEVSYSVERSKGTISKTYSRKCAEAEKLFLSGDYASAVSFLEPVVAKSEAKRS